MSSWEAVIGLEIHVHLKTRTKMFCGCELEYGAPENTRTCPVCLAHPGTLPVPNEQAIEWTVKLGLALGCEIAARALFHRKNYFYPDLPKGYQISQYDAPLCVEGRFVVPGAEGDHEIGITRAHLEEDAAKTVHVGGTGGRIGGADYSLVDFNRGGTPLVEIVTEPDLRSADEAKRFLQLLRQTIVELGISDAEMEKGTLRADANVSVREVGETGYRTRSEIKNMNSFNFIARGIEAEIERQIAVWESGGEVVQQTYDFDAASGTLTARRTKEEAEDYRYFPEPDLVPIQPPPGLVERLRREVPEPPGARVRRLEAALDFDTATGLVTSGRDRLYQAVVAAGADPRASANVVMNQLAGAGVDPDAVDPGELAKLIEGRESIPRGVFTEAIAASGDRGLRSREVPGGGRRERRVGARPRDRPDPGRERGAGRGVPRRQGGAARLLRRGGHARDPGQGGPQDRQRAPAREAEPVIPDASTLAVFVAAALALLLVPGPAVLYIVARSIDQGRTAGLVSVLGVHLGSLVHVAAAAIGLSSLIVSSAVAFSVVKYAGAAYLVYLGVRALLSREEPEEVEVRAAPNRSLLRQGAIVNILNPKTALFFLAFLPQFVDPAAGYVALQLTFFGLVFVALGLVTDSLYALAAGTAGNLLRTNRVFTGARRWVSGTVFIGLGLATAFSGSRQKS